MLHKYRNLHLWMIIPFVLMQTGFIDVYWLNWTEAQWMRHVHALTAMGWYLLLIIQPWLATHGKLQNHRTLGIIGFMLAGGTVFSAISLLPQDVEIGGLPDLSAPFTSEFFYGIVLVELIMMLGFLIAVIMAILRRKHTDDHALWLITTVFYIMMPGLGRGMFAPVNAVFGPDNWLAIAITSSLIILTLLIIGFRMRKLTHPAILLGIAVNIPTYFTYWLGGQSWYVEWLISFMKY